MEQHSQPSASSEPTSRPDPTPQHPVREPEFSSPDQYEPDHVHVRDEWKQALPDIYPFVEERHGERRQEHTPVTEDRRHAEMGDRRRPELEMPGFHIDNQPQDAAHVTIVMGAIPSVRQRIFVEQDFPGQEEDSVEIEPDIQPQD